MQGLHMRRRPVGMVNRGPAARDGKAAQKQSKQKSSDRSHKCGLSILAMRQLSSYQNQLPWQVNILFIILFSLLGPFISQAPLDKPHRESFPALVQTLEFGCDAAPDFHINYSQNRP
jgi:hypothetical protein